MMESLKKLIQFLRKRMKLEPDSMTILKVREMKPTMMRKHQSMESDPDKLLKGLAINSKPRRRSLLYLSKLPKVPSSKREVVRGQFRRQAEDPLGPRVREPNESNRGE